MQGDQLGVVQSDLALGIITADAVHLQRGILQVVCDDKGDGIAGLELCTAMQDGVEQFWSDIQVCGDHGDLRVSAKAKGIRQKGEFCDRIGIGTMSGSKHWYLSFWV